MRKGVICVLLCLSVCSSFGTSILTNEPSKDPLAGEFMLPLFNSGKFISLEDYLKLSPKSYRALTGHKLSFKEKINLVVMKKVLKKMIREDGTIALEKMKRGGLFGKFEWHWGGFALGFFLSILGPIVALFFNDDYKWDRFWTALHTAVYVFAIVGIILALSGGA